ncbi:hypothetical protein JHL17_02620 [Azospirillum sp. YIM B02556]|uniref:Uncharacterized protein n=1 Tax=Azospirillum endophyticum TaxID=2800326 RepID=A0ABS1EYX4_9PROT|nr:hypothetical protein [Azospirillum endophyticum]MBK1836297.1 hypothetical protein [Azospirillum endophyticum]
MKVTSDPTAAGNMRPSSTVQPNPQKSAVTPRDAGPAGGSSGVVVDIRSAIQNLKPGMSYSIGEGYVPADISAPGGDKMRNVGVTNFMNAFTDWSNKLSDYWGKVSDFAKKTLNTSGDEVAVLGGAANDIIRTSLAASGVTRPDMPLILKEGGANDPYDPSALANARTGEISIGHQGDGSSNLLSSVSFDRTVDIPDGQMSIVDLDSGDATANSLLASILSGSLGSALSSSDQSGKSGMHRYAVTNGKSGPDAAVGAVLFTRGNDDADVQKAAGLYTKLKSLQQA